MSLLQELSAEQIDEVLAIALERQIPVIVTIRQGDSWANLHSRALTMRDRHLLLEMPITELDAMPHEFVPAERVGVSFKLKHHKHTFAGTVVGQERLCTESGENVPVLAVVAPSRMQRLQRRAFVRAEVPANRIVRASFWIGGCTAEPTTASPEHPVWFGRVTNLSAGGFQVLADAVTADGLEVGDTLGMRLVFGAAREAVYADAQLRHVELGDGKAELGFQFLGLTETSEGRVALQMISAKVSEFQREAQRTGSFRHN